MGTPFITFNSIFSQFLGFMIPLIIVGLVAPAIADIGSKVGRLLLWAVGLAYVDTILAGLLGYGVGSWLFPQMVEAGQNTTLTTESEAYSPFFEIKIPPLFDVMAALVLSFVAGLSIAYCHAPTLKQGLCEMRKLVEIVIQTPSSPCCRSTSSASSSK